MDTPVPVDQAGRVALWRDAERAGRQLAEADQGRGRNALAVPPRHRHRADDPGGRRHPGPAAAQRHAAEADGRRQHGLYVRRREGPDAAHDPVFRDDGQPRDLSRRLDGQHDASCGSPGRPSARRPTPTSTRGSFTISPTTSASPRTWRRRTPRSSSICNPAF